MESSEGKRHFILVHGMCHGAWCWYKLKAMLESAGHKVTAVDLAACGIRTEKLDEIRMFADYSRPLIEAVASLPPDERVILVGHSYGGLSLAVVMEKFPERVSAAVFATAVMPSAATPLSSIAREYFTRCPLESFLDSKVEVSPSTGQPISITFGPSFLSTMLYQLCPPEDLSLATMLVRPGSWFLEDAPTTVIAAENYESVSRVYIVCKEDRGMTEDFQRWIIDHSPGAEVEEMEGADHMVMLSKPKELCTLLLEIARKYK